MFKWIFIITNLAYFLFFSQQFTVAHRKKQGVLQHPQYPLFPRPWLRLHLFEQKYSKNINIVKYTN